MVGAADSFLRHWALSQQEHKLTGDWARLAGPDRDKLDAGLLKLVKAGKSKKGSWLKAQIYAAIKEAHGADAKSTVTKYTTGVFGLAYRGSMFWTFGTEAHVREEMKKLGVKINEATWEERYFQGPDFNLPENYKTRRYFPKQKLNG